MLYEENLPEYLAYQYLPWRHKRRRLIIVSTNVTPEFKAWAREKYGQEIDFALTTPRDLLWTIERTMGKYLDEEARLRLYRIAPSQSARTRMDRHQSIILTATLSTILSATLYFPQMAIPAVLLSCNLLYSATIIFKCLLFAASLRFKPPITFPKEGPLPIKEEELPIYTLLMPMHHEAEGVPRLIKSITSLDYPHSKLDVKLIVEADDDMTQNAIKHCHPPECFEVIRVPHSMPKTKPKACNYALHFARGEFVTIYDAEDEPDPDQLKKAVMMFRATGEEVACLQGRLNYYNRNENLLTALFAIEYATLFHFFLPGLYVLGVPIPLSGTSNHFRLKNLRELGDWDAFNVTEDADLGIRSELASYRTMPLDSLTKEEATVSIMQWLKQRTRWIKGYMQTWLVAMRRSDEIYKKRGLMGYIGFQLFIGAPSLVYLIAPVLWGMAAIWIIRGVGEHTTLPPWLIATSGYVFAAGILTQWLLAIIVVRRAGWRKLGLAMLVFPFYWFLHSAASFRALWQLIVNPFYWDKTPHSLSQMVKNKKEV